VQAVAEFLGEERPLVALVGHVVLVKAPDMAPSTGTPTGAGATARAHAATLRPLTRPPPDTRSHRQRPAGAPPVVQR
jgi:hypothetical protein